MGNVSLARAFAVSTMLARLARDVGSCAGFCGINPSKLRYKVLVEDREKDRQHVSHDRPPLRLKSRASK
jgi:hypothetical protein